VAGDNLQEKHGVQTGTISYGTNGGTVDGYLARAADTQPHPGVILIQEWWGIEPHIKDMAERLARQGYVVLAPDLYHGKVAREPNEAMKQMMALNKDAAVNEIRKGIDYLQSRSDVQPKQLGVVGFCMGGFLTWKVAEAENGELAAIAPFYAGAFNPSPQDIAKVTAPALIVWGDEDGGIPADQRQHITTLLQQAHKTHKILVYHAGHAFMNDQHASHNKHAAEQAWDELLAWFKQYLG
jgi:carboxymethylenebutenolidase